MRAILGSLLCVATLACGSSEASRATDTASPPDTPAHDVFEAPDAVAASPDGRGDDAVERPVDGEPFDRSRVLEVAVTLPAMEWDALRTELPDPYRMRGADCLARPAPSPYTWREATVTLDGERYDRVAIRKKGGLTGMDTTRPALRLDLDRHVAKREWRGQDDLVLNRTIQDPAVVRTCVAYRLMAAAGVPSPRCAYAHVTVNDADLGVYVHVERLDKDFLEEHFEDATGALYEGATSDLREGWVGSFDAESDAAEDRTALDALAAAVGAAPADLDGVGARLTLDDFLTYWAMEALLESSDGYASNNNNFYLYLDPQTSRFRFLPWGLDAVLPVPMEPMGARVAPVLATALLPRVLYAQAGTRAQYLDRVAALNDALFGASALPDLLAQLDHDGALVRPLVAAEKRAQFDAELAGVRTALEQRHAAVARGLGEAPAAPPGELLASPCEPVLGHVVVAFDTAAGTFEMADPLATGAASFSGAVEGVSLITTAAGATAGAPEPDFPVMTVRVEGARADGTRVVAEVRVQRALWAVGTLALDRGAVAGSLDVLGSSGTAQPVGALGPGTLVLEAAGEQPGSAVRGSLTADVLGLP